MDVVDEYRIFEIPMEGYEDLMVEKFEAGRGVVHASSVPCTFDLRKEDKARFTAPGALDFIRSMLGMCLWLYRCSRFEIGFAVSQLCARIAAWSPECYRQLAILIAYVKGPRGIVFLFRMHVDDVESDLHMHCYSDADWNVPRSWTGAITMVHRERGSRMPVDARSVSQRFTADSTAAPKPSLPIQRCVTYWR